MASITIELPDGNSHQGVTKELLERAAEERGTSTDRVVGVALATLFGFRAPDQPEDVELRARLRAAGIDQQPKVSLLAQMDEQISQSTEPEGEGPCDESHPRPGDRGNLLG
ncbi:MAG: hypothetical protein E6Q40_11680 [Cupriavidus sp.]|nr:MAG: hypothetical protein E6Q40_11680 [Cupriavidus sp.]